MPPDDAAEAAMIYTRSPLEDSRLFGPSPWKILATTYEQIISEQPSPWRKSSKRKSCYGDRVYIAAHRRRLCAPWEASVSTPCSVGNGEGLQVQVVARRLRLRPLRQPLSLSLSIYIYIYIHTSSTCISIYNLPPLWLTVTRARWPRSRCRGESSLSDFELEVLKGMLPWRTRCPLS